MEQPQSLDRWDMKAARVHGESQGDESPAEVVVTGLHLTAANIFFLTLMFTISQAIIGAIIAFALYFLGVI